MSKHSPLPWRIGHEQTGYRWPVILSSSEAYGDLSKTKTLSQTEESPVEICSISESWPIDSDGTPEQMLAQANADLIVTAANNHDKLVEALRRLSIKKPFSWESGAIGLVTIDQWKEEF